MCENDLVTASFRECSITGRRYECGSVFKFDIFSAGISGGSGEAAVYLLLEHTYDRMTPMLTEFMQEGLIPCGMVLFVTPGTLPPSLPGGAPRRMRAEEFDQYGREFPDFLVEELIPEACRIAGITLSEDPDMHFICGSSSGGLAAWNCVWFRNDYFRRTFLSSPTFSAIRGGEEAMVIARKAEAKPIRIYITTGTEEPDYYFGSSLIAAQNAAMALEYAGYDLRFEQFNGEGHGCRREDVTLWRRMMAFLWANWQQKVPVMTLTRQIRIRKLVSDGSIWQKFDGDFPAKEAVCANGGIYSFDGGKIFFEKEGKKIPAAENFGEITALALSCDKWRLYIADRSRRFIFAMSIMPDGSLTQLSKHSPIHLAHDFRQAGCSDLAVLADDRLLAATELGIQGIISFGVNDLILPLPGDLPAEKVAVCGRILYAASGDQIFTRELKIAGGSCEAPQCDPASPVYNDGFSYNRSHLFFS